MPGVHAPIEPPALVRVQHRLTGPAGKALYVEIVAAHDGMLLAEYPSPRWAQRWLTDRGYVYVTGSSGLWGRA